MIYIATQENGRPISVTAFDSRRDFLGYADEVLSCDNRNYLVRSRSSSIDTICYALTDNGMGYGPRTHFRVSRREAKQIENGVVYSRLDLR